MEKLRGWLQLKEAEKKDILAASSLEKGRSQFALEKDLWVVAVLDVLFGSHFSEHLTFKGGTSLSKAYAVIERFSEDVDIAWSINDLLRIDIDPGLRGDLEGNGDRADRKVIEKLNDEIKPMFEGLFPESEVSVDKKSLSLIYPASAPKFEFQRARVLVEFDARSTGLPREKASISPFLSQFPANLIWDETSVFCFPPVFTFWEKLTAIHRMTTKNKMRWEDARHWYDIVKIREVLGIEMVLNKNVASEVIRNIQARSGRGEVDYRKMKSEGVSLLGKSDDFEMKLRTNLHMTIDYEYFLEPPDISDVFSKLELLEKELNAFLAKLTN